MRIRSYLAILVLACLLGAYMLEQVLGYRFNHVQILASKHTQNLFELKISNELKIALRNF